MKFVLLFCISSLFVVVLTAPSAPPDNSEEVKSQADATADADRMRYLLIFVINS